MSETLRPGGLIDLLEFDFRVYDENRQPFIVLPNTNAPYFARWMSLLNMAVRQRGGSPDAANMLHTWALEHPAFEDVVYREYMIPTAPFMSRKDPDYHFIRPISEMFREDVCVSIFIIILSNCANLVLMCVDHDRLFLNRAGHYFWAAICLKSSSMTSLSVHNAS